MERMINRWRLWSWARPRRDLPADHEHARELAAYDDLTDKDGNRWRLVPSREEWELERGVMIEDQARGITYRVTVDRTGRNPQLTSLEIDFTGGSRARIDQKLLEQVPLDFIRKEAARYLDEYDQLGPGEVIIPSPEGDPDVRAHGDVPDLAELARLYNEVGRAGVINHYRERYADPTLSRATIDRWIKAARQAGHLDPPARKTTTQTTGRKQRPGTTTKRS